MSILIVNRGGVSSSSGGGPSGGLKPELTVVAPSGSKLEISTGGSANGEACKVYYEGTEPSVYSSTFGAYVSRELLNEPGPSVGDTVYVMWDGQVYEDVVTTAAAFGNAPMFGDLTLASRPYVIGYLDVDGDGTSGWFFATGTEGDHTLKVFSLVEGSGGDKQIIDTYTLGENETEHTFTVDLGTYTVTGTLGEKSKSVDVVIDTVGQYSVKIEYMLWLYREGDECEDVTGGFSKCPIGSITNTTAPTKESDRLAFTSGYYPNLCTNNAIDVTSYTRLFAEIQATGTNKWHPWVGIFTAKNIDGNYRNALIAVGQDGDGTANKQVVSCDITSITGQKYIGAALTGDNAAGYVYNIWLE